MLQAFSCGPGSVSDLFYIFELQIHKASDTKFNFENTKLMTVVRKQGNVPHVL